MYIMNNESTTPILIPMEPEEFWKHIRLIIAEEIRAHQKKTTVSELSFQTPGLTYKPLYKIAEVCEFLQVTRPTLYEWIREGRLKPYKIKSRVYFLYQDILKILEPKNFWKNVDRG